MGPTPMTAGSTPATAVDTTRASGLSPSSRARSGLDEQDRRRPVVDPGAVARRDRAALGLERRPEPRERLERRVGARVLVAIDDERFALLLRDRDRHDLVGEPAGLDGGDGALLALERERVLALAADAPALGDVLRRLAHRVRVVALGEARVGEPPAERRVGHLARAAVVGADSALSWTYGARVIDSTPPAMNTSPSPTAIAWAAELIAWSPEPHSRLTVWPPTSTGKPASSSAIRATLRLSSPAWLAQPRMTSSIERRVDAGAIDDRADGRRRRDRPAARVASAPP